MKLDLLVLAAHPDDAEMSCGGLMAMEVANGKKVGIVDFTQGELGTRGTPEIRLQEAADAARMLGLSARENLGFRDGFFVNDEAHQLKVVEVIRRYQPEILIANAIDDRHPDHGKAAAVAETAHFLSGLRRIETFEPDGTPQAPWRARQVFHYIQDRYIKPDVVVDISDYWQQKVESIKAYRSQFFNPDSDEPSSYISSKEFMDFLVARWRELGHQIGVEFGEGYTNYRQIGAKNLSSLI
ncbi:bacillithiol biosynthesis deacetylase BshB1 [Siphonobacter sp. BAB-5385]|uniref:Bacillithiol biosynthesis deacetylase BshB1 n=1 Tax=Siphonobacter curvatus TaxID=2094562 RepID=A0A2S7IPY7_9BACT|nr:MULTISPECIES: bacillithiol biosynthesis deacetylase BshB1 [Siphonobacter]OZI08509.1 bacillithiol biosynthesis deacetylase BshB1 [Siphonobacter sp. BAB-5385]PMD99104.1 bacillithiol biosynthesis deacetylase BshB1 [Siphonobacter sp. BAB-5405]PQA59771.1 bacillithiol biosynthesis deacetylase BshB1 [Siphonobacter curvatus]